MNTVKTVMGLMLVCALSPTGVYADDTEIFFAKANADNSENKPKANVLFLIDTSGSMERDAPNSNRTKMQELQSAFSTVIDNLGSDIDVGLAKFNGGYDDSAYGGYVFYPVSEMNDAARTEIKQIVNGLEGTSNTPTMEAYSESARYMLGYSPSNYAKRGEAVENKPRRAVNIYAYNGRLYTKSAYDSPSNLNNQCESNHIIVMTDGDPTRDSDYGSVRNITGKNCSGSYDCQADLAKWIYNDGEDVNGSRKSIKTWQVALGVGKNSSQARNMKNVAEAGLGDPSAEVRFADNADELAAEFKEILDLVDKDSRTLSSPGVAVNQMNRFQYLDQLYYAVFTPNKNSNWEGNLKRYRLKNGEIVGVSGGNAIDPDTGYFKKDSRSLWSDEDDGVDVEKGGARGELVDRELYYNAGTVAKKLDWQEVEDDPEDWAAFFGLDANAPDDEVLDVANKLKVQWGDPLHSAPLLINYGGNENNNMIFVSTNGGMLHAINADDGSESYAFMPEEFVQQAEKYTSETYPLTNDNRRQTYGLDGSWVAWRKPNATDPVTGKPEHVYIYGGMRRGGRTYYALDVSSKTSPKVKWKIEGGVTNGFSDLGQSWSIPTLTQIMVGDKKVPVLVFGGGYSANDNDNRQGKARNSGDSMGNAIYIVNAETGKLIWSTSGGEMKWSVPGSISVVDKNLDGLADFLYFGDLGGQIFRVDIDQSGGKKMAVHRLAQLGGAGASGNRRFYDAPAVVYVVEDGKKKLYVVAGSGYRSHPLDESVDDALFVVKDETAMTTAQAAPTEVGLEDLTNASAETPATTDKGWFYPMQVNGEKILASPTVYTTVDDDKNTISVLAATSYSPTRQDQQESPCAVTYGSAALYRVNLLTGSGVDYNNDGVADEPPRTELKQTGIPPALTDMPGGSDGSGGPTEGVGCVGTECLELNDEGFDHLRKRRWYQMEKDEANQFKVEAMHP
ncbi:PilC/PilY family type IV pilus protein [Alcanivorax sp.]|jgi:type IV pilus assembly protein PilY1|uniref:pilus assembly protein n=1 Tax=Alcanivorax sp. TaxID=1872427 RepID=UPI0025BF259D|nr:PilC/PilY family type IV pilus protein [Alcanivorax sp.]